MALLEDDDRFEHASRFGNVAAEMFSGGGWGSAVRKKIKIGEPRG